MKTDIIVENNYSEFDVDLLKATILTTIKEADGYGYVRDIIKQYGDDFSISISMVTDDVARKLIGNSYQNIEKLDTAIEDIYLDIQNEGKDYKPSSGSSGGGGGSKISNVTVPVNVPNPDTNTDYSENSTGFQDLVGYEWAAEAINTLKNLSVINGKTETSFGPGDKVLREEFVKIAMRTAYFADIYGDFRFDDVSESDWFYQDVKNAYLSGIISGISETRFGSGLPISRQDMAVILYNVLTKKGVTLEKNNGKTFVDEEQISDYAKEAINALSAVGIITGNQNGDFNPMENATRAEAAKMVYGIISYIER